MRSVAAIALALLLATLAQALFARSATQNDAFLLVIAAGLVMAVALGGSTWPASAQGAILPSRLQVSATARRHGAFALAGAFLVALAGSLWTASNWARFLDQALVLYFFAGLLAAYGFSRIEGWRWRASLNRVLRGMRDNWWEVLAFAAIFAFGAWMRFGRIGYFPPPDGIGLVDEAQLGQAGTEILEGYRSWIYAESVYAIALFFKVFGASLTVLRLPAALYGVLHLVPFYLLARSLVGRPAALAATLLFAASRWHAMGSRIVISAIPDSFIELTIIYLVYRGWRTGGGLGPCLSAGLLVLGLLGYAGFRIVPVMMVLVIMVKLGGEAWRLLRSQREQRRLLWQSYRDVYLRSVVILAISFLGFSPPWLSIVSRDARNALTERFTSILPIVTADDKMAALQAAGGNLRRALLWFSGRGDAWPVFNIPGLPMLDPISGILFAIAAVVTLLNIRRGDTVLPVAWFWLTLIGGAALTHSVSTYRVLGLVPAIFLMIAYLLSAIWKRLQCSVAQRHLRVAAVGTAALLLLAAYINADVFFGRWMHLAETRGAFANADAITASYLGRQSGNPYVYLTRAGTYFSPRTDLGWLARFPRGRLSHYLGGILPGREEGGSDALYVFMWPYDDPQAGTLVSGVYPAAACERYVTVSGSQSYLACRVAADDIAAARGLRARYYRGETTEGEPALIRQDAALDVVWDSATVPFDGVFSAAWEGSFYVSAFVPVTMALESSAPMTVEIDGKAALAFPAHPERVLTLAQGWHTIRAVTEGARTGGSARLLEVQQGKRGAITPDRFSTIAVHGALARFYAGQQAQGTALWQRIDPYLDFLALPEHPENRPAKDMPAGPFTGDWAARLAVVRTGAYGFRVNARGGQATLYLNGQQVAQTNEGGGDQITTGEATINLAPGDHVLRLTYTYKQGGVARAWLSWTPPGGANEPIPYQALTPLMP